MHTRDLGQSECRAWSLKSRALAGKQMSTGLVCSTACCSLLGGTLGDHMKPLKYRLTFDKNNAGGLLRMSQVTQHTHGVSSGMSHKEWLVSARC